jgi:penicillin-binding protein 1A
MGHDTPKSLGASETGAAAALPIWMAYMESALRGMPDEPMIAPEGVVAARVNPSTGLRDTQPGEGPAEFFLQENLPAEDDVGALPTDRRRAKPDERDDQLY